jgi:methylated-DNA-[protein]-cysteine S-methyltransferase
MFYTIYNTAYIGDIILFGDKKYLYGLEFYKNSIIKKDWIENRQIFDKALKELALYFDGKLKNFSIDIKLTGTSFQKKIYQELLNIPYGKTVSYQEIAKKIGNPKASRAVGNANGKNPIAVIVPCHRVISKNGTIGGFSAEVEIKRKLLKLEGVTDV